jgi:hypothetical protein
MAMSGERGVAQPASRIDRQKTNAPGPVPFGHHLDRNGVQSGRLIMIRIDVNDLALH